jgi:hypothetical protein
VLSTVKFSCVVNVLFYTSSSISLYTSGSSFCACPSITLQCRTLANV